jgi:hypothetical protein
MRYLSVVFLFFSSFWLNMNSNQNSIETTSNSFKKIKEEILKIAKKKNIPAFDLLIQKGEKI